MKKLIFSSLMAMLMLVLSQQNGVAQETKKNEPIEFVKMKNPPTYPGGMKKFYEFLGQNIKYPPLAVKNKVQGNVYISFNITPNGSVEDVKVIRPLGSGTDEEAVRVIKLAEKWNPGMVDGKPVTVRYNIPVKFSLNKKV